MNHQTDGDFVTDVYPTLSEEERVRVDLAAAYHLIEHFQMSDSIYTHISASVPGDNEYFLINPYGTRFGEVKASQLVMIDVDGKIIDDPCNMGANPAGFTIHSAIHQARTDLKCALHTHTVAGVSVSSLQTGILPINQWALQFYHGVSRHKYEGIALNLEERERLVKDLGPSNKILILDNHGLMTMGKNVGEAFTLMFNLERVCKVQMSVLASGQPVNPIDSSVCDLTYEQYLQFAELSQRDGFHVEWLAYLRLLEKVSPSYKE
ncbi:class II aldolase/adducin family protein [Cocleimonas flava]|jgi:ribulose-5-phosphate 4-epimerase/fuculose-1-phosphate aldolase|uniref:Ribulose-5-phosphate 4-epimerase/fuculose-1-phosphate aldolase n=1 Tax=Cocleimonas flava TaxID=634765 RepID=A0A4R1ENA6_9GAMM|nr:MULTISPECIES: class II aldolase/adducin family protein [Cocleimonas]MEB8433252.1 class II aldolase/adducin family protein [Cocleimonas sp. KMM 6892]MEC4715767.1 class II aldolase/adducin family protein [Cocleimonas sp. KMM 6895]MEC4745228.1 class II aldolase/adducin family protein [Cocleimonas sp. KMM 6896]TCJ82717.1 ribulose-5-phosphate 4-epimerase/fuculose-1-phosphate aldolase [Cocleimonas flava]